jgi:hypothetical protein
MDGLIRTGAGKGQVRTDGTAPENQKAGKERRTAPKNNALHDLQAASRQRALANHLAQPAFGPTPAALAALFSPLGRICPRQGKYEKFVAG